MIILKIRGPLLFVNSQFRGLLISLLPFPNHTCLPSAHRPPKAPFCLQYGWILYGLYQAAVHVSCLVPSRSPNSPRAWSHAFSRLGVFALLCLLLGMCIRFCIAALKHYHKSHGFKQVHLTVL